MKILGSQAEASEVSSTNRAIEDRIPGIKEKKEEMLNLKKKNQGMKHPENPDI